MNIKMEIIFSIILVFFLYGHIIELIELDETFFYQNDK